MKYTPIDCNFYDILEASAVLKKVVELEYQDEKGHLQKVNSRIVNLFVKEKAEYMQLENDDIIRLDALESVDGIRLKGFCEV